jgi:transcriptional regulator with GAF, ATPase, and Fis domain
LIKVNCAAIPRELFESEFFGHVKGSFTGAIKDRVGRFQLADGGTIFLDEIGEIPTDLQSKLLRVLQEGVFERIGEERSRQTNVRIVAATNRDLTEEIAAKRFREDLYYRLSVFPIRLPPLRERADDIPLIAEHFLIQSAKRFGRKPLAMNRSHVEQLKSYRWPGNVRELQHVIERSVIISERGSLQIALDANPSLQATSSSDGVDPPSEDRVLTYRDLEDLEKRNIELALKQCGGRVSGASGAAKLLELNPSTLTSRIKSLKIRIARPTDDQTQA